MATLQGKTLFITGASRGIGLAMALRAARDGARVIVAAKTDAPHPKLPGTIHSAADEIRKAGGEALAVRCDIRFADQVDAAVEQGVAAFGGIDICVNNASAISLTPTLETSVKAFDLMQQVNTRGTWMVSRACLPHLLKTSTPHILTLSPPLNLHPRWFGPHTAYSLSKYGMSLIALGLAEELTGRVAVNALWPQTIIATAAIWNLLGGQEAIAHCRKPEIMGDAAHAILTKGVEYSGRFLRDEEVLREEGVSDFDGYAYAPGQPLQRDLFVE
jgi:citronellol/citronellal dehydrogenase